jgi:glycine dehydrogenase subunit 1
LANCNRGAELLGFLGAGAYDHWFPIAADQLLLRSEFYTAYTPYQPEVAQGTLQVIFEFQTIVSEILGLPVANASMYDASTGTAEAALMARRLTKRSRMVVSECLHPQYRDTIRTFTRGLKGGTGVIESIAVTADCESDVAALCAAIDDQTACVIVSYPTFYGTVSDLKPLADAAHAAGALLVTMTPDPFALALIASPGDIGADIAVAEGQPLGLPPQYGGPGVGLFACRGERKVLQQMPGRLCGETVDQDGQRGFVLTLSTREQHIRRERATSNICTNSGLCATALTIKMCMLGKQGFIGAAERCLSKTEYLKQAIAQLDGYALASRAKTFNEFVLRVRGGDAGAVTTALVEQGILAGLDLGRVDAERQDQLLIAVTEKHAQAELDRFVDALAAFSPS